jgi:hypothetical protein
VKKLIVALGVGVMSLVGIHAASADPSVTVCHDVNINVNGTAVADAGCNTLPPAVPAP